MKKWMGYLLIFALVMSLCACGHGSSVDKESDGEKKAEVTADLPEEPQPVAEESILGEIQGSVYQNKFIGIACSLKDGWTFYDEAKMNELNNIPTGMLSDEVKTTLRNAKIVHDMCAVDEKQLNKISVSLEKVNVGQLMELDIAENYSKLIPSMQAGYESMGITNFEHEIGTVTVAAETLDALYVTYEMNSVKVYQVCFAVKCNGYLANITATTHFEDLTRELVDRFYWI